MDNRRDIANRLQNSYINMIDKSDKPFYFQSHLSHLQGGIIQHERRADAQFPTEPPTLYVGSPVINYPKSLLKDVRGEGGKINFGRVLRGAKNIYDKIPEPIKAKAKELIIKKSLEALAGAGRKPRKPRALAGGINRSKKAKKWLGFVANDLIPSGIKSAESVYASAKKMGGAVKKPNARAVLVKKVMKEHGFSLCQASSFVKKNGLY